MLMVNHAAQMKAMQEIAVSLTVAFQTTPRVDPNERAEAHDVGSGIWHVVVRFGFLEIPNVATALAHARDKGCPVHLDDAVYFAACDEVVRSPTRPRLYGWQRTMFGFMYCDAVRASDLFDLPPDSAVDIGRHLPFESAARNDRGPSTFSQTAVRQERSQTNRETEDAKQRQHRCRLLARGRRQVPSHRSRPSRQGRARRSFAALPMRKSVTPACAPSTHAPTAVSRLGR